MRVSRVAPIFAALGMCLASPAQAGAMSGAEKLRRLDIMLMVTGLRCRAGRDDFMADYGRFTTRQMGSLNGAERELRQEIFARYGTFDGRRALDRLETVMANDYGRGHPWLDCGELKQVTRNLAEVEGRATLEEAADQLLARNGSPQIVLAKR